jgi:serine/threonine-protein kinase
LAATGPAVRVLDGVFIDGTGAAPLALSASGTLVYEPGGFGGIANLRTLTWVSRDGVEQPLGAPPRAYVYARISPDGTRIALDARDDQSDIWIWDTARSTLTRLTFDPRQNISPVWTRDSERIIFAGDPADGGPGLFWQAANGAGAFARLTSLPALANPTALTPDGTRLLFHVINNPRDISALALRAGSRPEAVLQTAFDEASAELSPDGKWLAYSSNESGRYEIYVRPFPEVDSGRWQVSGSGGTRPMWARDGRSIFYMTQPVLTLMEVPIQGGARFAAGPPRVAIKGPNGYLAPQYSRPYDVSPDGRRFLMIQNAQTPEGRAPVQQPLVVIQNWLEDLTRLVPAD